MNGSLTGRLRAEKAGRKLSEYYLEDLRCRAERLLRGLELEEHICLMTFGSAGNRFLTGYSDTDFTVIDDGTVSREDISRLQQGIYEEFGGAPWCVSFKCWDRLKVNPMDVISIYYLCGSEGLYGKAVLSDAGIADTISRDKLVTVLVGNDLHLEFMASRYFSRLLNKYHPNWELPVPISFGDVKYYLGGLRSIQYLYMTAMVLSGKRFISEVAPEDLVSAGFLTGPEAEAAGRALDFMLSAKDQCVEGNNIFHRPNLERLMDCWGQPEDEIRAEYERHARVISTMCGKAHGALVRAFPDNIGVEARVGTDISSLERIIHGDSPDLWRTLALRRDLPGSVRKLLEEKVLERQKSRPHTMIDELAVMLEYTAGMPGAGSGCDEEAEERDLWLTDSVFRCFNDTLGNSTDDPALVRLAVHSGFFGMFSAGRYSGPDEFCREFLDRVRKYFHCHTLCPDREAETAEKACGQIMSSGLFVRGNITLMEIHPTNRCNLDCSWCTYRGCDRTAALTMEDILNAAALRLAEVLIAGGGEPTLFRDGQYTFSDAVRCLRNELPGARLRLITNGTFIPDGDWTDHMDEISISVDDSTREEYIEHKGADLFEKVWSNIEEYLTRRSPSIIRVTKIYNSENIAGSLALAEKLYRLWKGLPDGSVKKKHFRFMLFPMANDREQGAAYSCSILDGNRMKEWKEALNGAAVRDPELYEFLAGHTNLLTVADSVPPEGPSEYCTNPAHYLLLGADGKYYPCFAACSSFRSVNLGPAAQSREALYEKRCELIYRKPLGCGAGCRPGNVFYGQRSREYLAVQRELGLPAPEKPEHSGPFVVHISYQDPDHIMGGQGWAVSNLCKEQVRQGMPVCWISPCVKDEQPGEYLYENGKLRVIKLRFTEQYVETLFSDDYEDHLLRESFGKVAEEELIKRFGPEECVVHLHGFIEVPSHSERLRSLGYRVVSTFHMLLSARRQHILSSGGDLSYMKEAERKAVAANACISVPAQGMIDELSAACPDYKGVYVCIPNGIGDEHFDTPKTVSPGGGATIVSYGRISPEKGFDLLIEAAKLYYSRAGAAGPRADFVIFGNTDMSVEARRLYAERLAGMASGHDGIKVLASTSGLVGADKINMIDKAVFGVIPSLYEPFGLVIPELMARGKPVIAARTSGAYDIMKTKAHGRNDFGFIVDQDPEEIYKAVIWLLEHPEEREQMGRNAFRRAQDFRWSLIAGQFRRLYGELRP